MENLLPDNVVVPPVYFWTEVLEGIPTIMTAAVRWNGLNFGLSFPVDKNVVRTNMDKKKLTTHLREIVSVLVLYGKDVLDNDQQIDMKKVNEMEARSWSYDPHWNNKVKGIDQLTKIKEITREQAVRLKLLDERKLKY